MKNRNTIFTTILLVLGCFALPSATQATPSPPSPPSPTNVNVVNTPNVNVANTTASPVLVRDVDNVARQPFHAEAVGGFADGGSTTRGLLIPTVPAGKRLVIEHVSAFARMPIGQSMVGGVLLADDPGALVTVRFHWDRQGHNADGSLDYFVASEPVKFYNNDGLPVAWEVERDNVSGALPHSVDINCDGYLEDCPTCAQ
jgi:hypothetical protein